MHCGYHCTAHVGEPERRITVHEIAGGPFHQLIFATRGIFVEHLRGKTAGGRDLETSIRAFNASALGAVEIAVSGGASPQVDWKIVPLTRAAVEVSGLEHQPVSGSLRF